MSAQRDSNAKMQDIFRRLCDKSLPNNTSPENVDLVMSVVNKLFEDINADIAVSHILTSQSQCNLQALMEEIFIEGMTDFRTRERDLLSWDLSLMSVTPERLKLLLKEGKHLVRCDVSYKLSEAITRGEKDIVDVLLAINKYYISYTLLAPRCPSQIIHQLAN